MRGRKLELKIRSKSKRFSKLVDGFAKFRRDVSGRNPNRSKPEVRLTAFFHRPGITRLINEGWHLGVLEATRFPESYVKTHTA